MIEERGRVVALSQDEIWVQTVQQNACNSCAARKGCGQKLLNSASAGRAQQIRVANHLDARVGDEVVLGIPEAALLKASAVLYLVPLLSMIIAAVAVHALVSGQDGWVILGGLAGLAAGFVAARRFGRSPVAEQTFAPILLRKEPGGVAFSEQEETLLVCPPGQGVWPGPGGQAGR